MYNTEIFLETMTILSESFYKILKLDFNTKEIIDIKVNNLKKFNKESENLLKYIFNTYTNEEVEQVIKKAEKVSLGESIKNLIFSKKKGQ